MTTTRRDALGLVTAAGLVASGTGALAGCGGDEEDSGRGGDPVRIPASEVPEGGGLVRDRVVIVQPSAGEFSAFDATCPHQGCAVDEVTSRAIICPCHGSEFDPTSGEVTQGPATEGLPELTVTAEGDDLVVS